jgi:hypothetical protein
MLACKAGVECQPSFGIRQHYHPHNSLTAISSYFSKSGSVNHKCGSDFAYLYFCSFVFLSSFLVSRVDRFIDD